MIYFQVISKLMDLKVVQWCMLICIVGGLLVGGVFTLKYNGLRLQHAIVKSTNSDLFSGILIQNNAIKKLGEETKLKEKAIKQAQVQAKQVAIATAKELEKVRKYNFKKGATCNEKIKAVFSFISSSR